MKTAPPIMQPIPWVEPARAFAALACGERASRHVAFLDSGGACGDTARWSVLAADPFDVIAARLPPPGSSPLPTPDAFDTLARALAPFRAPRGPVPFARGGAIGYLGYDLRHLLERLPRRLPESAEPSLWFGLYDTLLIFDRRLASAWLVSTGVPETSARAAGLRRRERARAIIARLEGLGGATRRSTFTPLESGAGLARGLAPAVGSRAFGEAVERAKALIAAGDIYQVNLSYPVTARAPLAAPRLYQRLREISPAPFGAYLDPGPFQVLSNSPERFLLLEADRVETRPIKGTRPRRTDGVEDAGQAAALLASAKDRAEHVMIVDLERNDLGRIAVPGSVRVERLAGLESYANVHHLVSVVSAKPRTGTGPVDVLRACFPGGSITGAPKIRAMEIIESLEGSARGVYTGAIGGIDFSGRMDFSVAIRTAVVEGGRVRFHVGGGIVADSKPEEEYRETVTKAEAFARLLTPRSFRA